MSTRQLHVRVRAVHGRVDGRCAAAYGPCTRRCNVSCARYTAAVYTAREHVFARENGPYTAVYGPCTRPVYTTRVHDYVRAVCTDVFGRVHGAYTAPYTGRLHGRVRAIYTAENGRLHGRTRPCNVSCIRPCTGHIGSYTRQCTGRVHGPFSAVYTGRVHCRFRQST